MIDLNLLPVFASLMAHRHVGRAAVSLGMSQPGLSYALRRLRQHFNDPLFIRTRTGMAPTDTAERIAPLVLRMLEDTRTHLVPTLPFEPATSTRTFALRMSDLGELIILPKLLGALARWAPAVRIRVQSIATSDLAANMQSGETDLAIGYIPQQQGGALFQQRLYTHGFVCIARIGHPRIGTSLDRETFLSLPHVSIQREGRSQQVIERFYARRGIPPRLMLQTPNILSVPAIVAATDFIATVPLALAELFDNAAGIQTFQSPVPLPKITVRQCWHRRHHADPAHRWFRELIRTLFTGTESWRLSTRARA